MSYRRAIVIGDTHGCIDELRELIGKLLPTPSDRLVFLGDFMDRGPDPVECVRIVRELGAESVKGNHDDKHVRWRSHEQNRGLKKNPIRFTDDQAKQNVTFTDEEIAWMTALPFWSERWRGLEKIVYGHHIHRFLGPRIDSHEIGAFGSGVITECVGIDTGCYAGGRLTAMILRDDGSYYFEHVNARRVYYPLSDKYGDKRPAPLAGVEP